MPNEVEFAAVLAAGRTALQFDGEDGGAYLRLAVNATDADALCLMYLYLRQGGEMRAPMKVRIAIDGGDEPVEFMAQLVTGVTALQFDGFDGGGMVRFLVAPDFDQQMVALKRHGKGSNLAVHVEVLRKDQISYQKAPGE